MAEGVVTKVGIAIGPNISIEPTTAFRLHFGGEGGGYIGLSPEEAAKLTAVLLHYLNPVQQQQQPQSKEKQQ